MHGRPTTELPDNGHADAVRDRRPHIWRFANFYGYRPPSGSRRRHLVTITSAEEQAWIEAPPPPAPP